MRRLLVKIKTHDMKLNVCLHLCVSCHPSVWVKPFQNKRNVLKTYQQPETSQRDQSKFCMFQNTDLSLPSVGKA